jgi:hypothetical protein
MVVLTKIDMQLYHVLFFGLQLHKILKLVQTFLEKGHTYMERDSVHAAVGRGKKKRKKKQQQKNKDIYIQQRYVELIQDSRERQDSLFQVKYVDYHLCSDFSKLKYFTSIRPLANLLSRT